MLVSVATDDPAMFGLSLAGEYEALVERLGFTRDGVRGLIQNGVESSWLAPDRKANLLERVLADPAWRE